MAKEISQKTVKELIRQLEDLANLYEQYRHKKGEKIKSEGIQRARETVQKALREGGIPMPGYD